LHNKQAAKWEAYETERGNTRPVRSSRLLASDYYVTQQPFWLSQRLDHFASQDRRAFRQRYYHFKSRFHYRRAYLPTYLWRGHLLRHFQRLSRGPGEAAIVCLEHRYYGKSSPFEELTTDNLKYLSSKQALFDLASFRNFYQDLINK
jgi:hypothetical protein